MDCFKCSDAFADGAKLFCVEPVGTLAASKAQFGPLTVKVNLSINVWEITRHSSRQGKCAHHQPVSLASLLAHLTTAKLAQSNLQKTVSLCVFLYI